MESKSYSRYRDINSVIHKIDPITKFISFIIITSTIFIAINIVPLTFVFLSVIFISFFARLKIKSYFIAFLFLIPFYLLMLFFYWISLLDIKEASIIVGYLTFRMYIFIIVAIIFTSTTKEIDIVSSIDWILTPLRLIKVPTYEISMILMLAIRFVPLMFEDLLMIKIAQTSRGYNVYNGNIFTRISGTFNSLLPMLVLSFKRSDDISNSMIIRGYEIGKKRTKYKKNKFKFLELISISFVILILLTVVYMGVIY